MKPRDHPDHGRLHKLRPVVDKLNDRFQSIPLQQYLCVDRQLCATKGRYYVKQYLLAKPHKWEYKLYMLCGTDGF
ncbi:hypothetical protein NQ314_014240 [Rhamnusium bicolor]|uniref:PiggyBac transposable element-derived protein domain-containing protein n=1 Tax=Rhamnusium bicolor TaxID=1586634 RepID=A0AAV8X3X0_9CUCU|nr:hypothetical protein NQ314_014240 [Rhamnusium bicolor]